MKTISRKFVQAIAHRSEVHKEKLMDLLKEENKEKLKLMLHMHEVWDLLEKYSDAHFTPQEIVDFLLPLLPRFYSIASAEEHVGNEVHLTVAYVHYETSGITRHGVCAHYLCTLAPLGEPVVSIYLHPSQDFHLPENPEAPMIMIGPGTGIAPFRGFMQKREALKHSGKNWLFFGERSRKSEYFYENEWERWKQKGLLKIDLAFSRDQPHKIYVQDKMKEAGRELIEWLDQGAYIYVCGDAHRMAKDVDLTLHDLLQEHKGLSPEEAAQYVKNLRQVKRYLRDVY